MRCRSSFMASLRCLAGDTPALSFWPHLRPTHFAFYEITRSKVELVAFVSAAEQKDIIGQVTVATAQLRAV